MKLDEVRVSGETVFSGRVFSVELDKIRLPDGREGEREVIRHPGGAAILALDGENRVVLVRQYRYALGRVMLEIPAGRREPGEPARETALRELREETGYRAGRVEDLGEVFPTGGYNSEGISLFLARELVRGEPNPDDGEFLETMIMPFDEVLEKVLSGEISDGKTAVAVLKTRLLKNLPK